MYNETINKNTLLRFHGNDGYVKAPPCFVIRPSIVCLFFNLLKRTGHVMHQQFNIQQLYVLPTLYLCVLYLSENKQRLVPLTV